jgi:hypothetical protein
VSAEEVRACSFCVTFLGASVIPAALTRLGFHDRSAMRLGFHDRSTMRLYLSAVG